ERRYRAADDAIRLVAEEAKTRDGFDRGRAVGGRELFEPIDERRDVAGYSFDRNRLAARGAQDHFTRRQAERMRIAAREDRLQEKSERVHVARGRQLFAAGLLGA